MKGIFLGLGWLASLAITFIVSSHLTLQMLGHDSSWAEVLKATSDAMTSIGIFAAGAWALYLIRRRRSLKPRIELIHHAQLWSQAGAQILRLAVEPRNADYGNCFRF